MAEIDKDRQSLQVLEQTKIVTFEAQEKLKQINKKDLKGKGVKIKDTMSNKDALVLEKKIKDLKLSINKKLSPISCLQNPMLEDILKIRGIHGGIYKL